MKLNVLCSQCGCTKPDPEQACPVCTATAEPSQEGGRAARDLQPSATDEDLGAAGSPFAPGYEPVRVELPPAPAAPWARLDEDQLVLVATADACIPTALVLLVAAALVSLFFAGGAMAIAGLGAGLAAIGTLSRRSQQASMLAAAHLLLLVGVLITGAATDSRGMPALWLALAACTAAAWIAAGPRLARHFRSREAAS